MKELFQKYRSIIMYLVFGVATTLVNWFVYVPCTMLFGSSPTNFQLMLCNAVAWVAAVAFAYITNKLFVFESKCMEPAFLVAEIARFVGARLFSGLFEISLPSLLISLGLSHTVFGIEGAVAKAITSVVVIVMNYVLSRRIVFRKKKAAKSSEE